MVLEINQMDFCCYFQGDSESVVGFLWAVSSIACLQVPEQGAVPGLLRPSVNPQRGCAISRRRDIFLFFLPGNSGCRPGPEKTAHTHTCKDLHTQAHTHTNKGYLKHCICASWVSCQWEYCESLMQLFVAWWGSTGGGSSVCLFASVSISPLWTHRCK